MRWIVLGTYNLLRLLTWPLWAIWWRVRRSRARWVVLTLQGKLEQLPRPPRRLQRLLASMRPARRSVAELRRLADRLADDPHAEGLLLRLERVDAGYATLASLRGELVRLRGRGKRVVCYLPLEASQRELYIASAAERIVVMPHAGFTALGPLASRTYLAPLLGRIGVQVVVTAEGRFKSAADPFVRDSMSEAEREQLEAIVRTLHDGWVADVGTRPQLGEGGARALFEAGVFGAARAKELAAVDDTAYDDELAGLLGFPERTPPIAHDRYLARSGALPTVFRPMRRAQRVVVVRLVGAISERGRSGTSSGIDLHGTTATLRALRKSKQVAGVILYIDSPGGSAIVSELLHREIQQLAKQKPVVTWMGDVAASGGYYMAAASHAIVAQPSTLTGSIGVISIRPVAERLFSQLGIRREVVSMTPFADLETIAHPPSAADEALLRAETARFYERFLEVVAQGRKQTRERIAELAQGRVWSGRDAHVHGLVDVLGGYEEARAALDALPGSSTAKAEREPVLLAPTLKPSAAMPPLPQPSEPDAAPSAELRALWSTCRPLLTGAIDGDVAREAWRSLLSLYELAQSGERVLAYASTLPVLH